MPRKPPPKPPGPPGGTHPPGPPKLTVVPPEGLSPTAPPNPPRGASGEGFSESTREGPNLGGRPPHVPTDHARHLVSVGRTNGYAEAVIAGMVGVSVETLKKHYAHELEYGFASLGVILTTRAVAIARDPKDPKSADMVKFLLSTKYGFNDKPKEEGTGEQTEKWTVSIGKAAGAGA